MSLFRIDTHPTGPSLRLAFAYLPRGAVFGLEQNRFWDFAGQRYRGTKIYRTRVNSFHNPIRRIQSIRVSRAPLRRWQNASREAATQGMRRFTRLTNAFSKKVENHAAMVAIHFLYYNFGRIHKTLRVTPAMAAGLADHVWSLEELVLLA